MWIIRKDYLKLYNDAGIISIRKDYLINMAMCELLERITRNYITVCELLILEGLLETIYTQAFRNNLSFSLNNP